MTYVERELMDATQTTLNFHIQWLPQFYLSIICLSIDLSESFDRVLITQCMLHILHWSTVIGTPIAAPSLDLPQEPESMQRNAPYQHATQNTDTMNTD